MELPLFPLHNVLFPGRRLPLHIFEPRYRTLLDDCLERDRRFGIVAIRSGREVGEGAELFRVGTVALIEEVDRFDDGRALIVTRGAERFRIDDFVPPAPYLRGQVTLLGEHVDAADLRDQLRDLRSLLLPYLAGLGAPKELLHRLPASCEELAWLAAATIQVDLADQQRLLELDSASERVETTIRMLRRETGIRRHLGTVGSLRPAGPGGVQLN